MWISMERAWDLGWCMRAGALSAMVGLPGRSLLYL